MVTTVGLAIVFPVIVETTAADPNAETLGAVEKTTPAVWLQFQRLDLTVAKQQFYAFDPVGGVINDNEVEWRCGES